MSTTHGSLLVRPQRPASLLAWTDQRLNFCRLESEVLEVRLAGVLTNFSQRGDSPQAKCTHCRKARLRPIHPRLSARHRQECTWLDLLCWEHTFRTSNLCMMSVSLLWETSEEVRISITIDACAVTSHPRER